MTFHDSVELFLVLAGEHLNANFNKQTKFEQYFELVDEKLSGTKLLGQARMRSLNEARVGLKHHFNLPDSKQIDMFQSSVMSFFEDNTPLLFGVEFQSISMVDLVQSQDAVRSLKAATTYTEQANYDEAIRSIALAFSQLLRDYEMSKLGGRRHSPFFFGESFVFESAFNIGVKDQKLGAYIDKVKKSIEALQGAVRILSMGIDYQRYSKFKWLTPAVSWMYGGNADVSKPPHPPVSEEDCIFCFNFVIDTALRLQEFDYELDDHD